MSFQVSSLSFARPERLFPAVQRSFVRVEGSNRPRRRRIQQMYPDSGRVETVAQHLLLGIALVLLVSNTRHFSASNVN